jgi:hypothetical protein
LASLLCLENMEPLVSGFPAERSDASGFFSRFLKARVVAFPV